MAFAVAAVAAGAVRLRRPPRQRLAARLPRAASVRTTEDASSPGAGGRRQAMLLGVAAAGATIGSSRPWPSVAAAEGEGAAGARMALLRAIDAGVGVEEAVEALVPFDPAEGRGARVAELSGTWRLLWSSSEAEVSRVLRVLPGPLLPTSMQLIGDRNIGDGRAANVLDFFGGVARMELSSSAVPSSSDQSSIVIGPPFRLALLAGGLRLPLGAEEDELSDTTPLLGNQQSIFRQRYLEMSGAPGDLRISRVVSGDPAVVGSAFVHQRL